MKGKEEKIDRGRDLRRGVKKTTKAKDDEDKFPDTRVCDSESEDDEGTTLMKKKKPKIYKKEKEKKKKKKKKKIVEEREDILQKDTLKPARSMDDLRDTGEFPMRKAKSEDDLLGSKRRKLSEIKHIMYENAVKLRDRDGKLDDLVEKGSRLEMSAEVFFTKTREIKKRTFCKKWKLLIILGIVIGVVVVTIVVVVVVVIASQKSEEKHGSTKVTNPP